MLAPLPQIWMWQWLIMADLCVLRFQVTVVNSIDHAAFMIFVTIRRNSVPYRGWLSKLGLQFTVLPYYENIC